MPAFVIWSECSLRSTSRHYLWSARRLKSPSGTADILFAMTWNDAYLWREEARWGFAGLRPVTSRDTERGCGWFMGNRSFSLKYASYCCFILSARRANLRVSKVFQERISEHGKLQCIELEHFCRSGNAVGASWLNFLLLWRNSLCCHVWRFLHSVACPEILGVCFQPSACLGAFLQTTWQTTGHLPGKKSRRVTA